MHFSTALLVSALTGFISLSYEILWFRVYSFASLDSPRAFGLLLGSYLIGLAVGAFVAGGYCRRHGARDEAAIWMALVALAFLASLAGYATVPAIARLATVTDVRTSLAVITAAATLFGAMLPVIAHLAIAPDARAGARLSYIYLANILGAVAGSLITGFVLSDSWTTAELCAALGALGALLALWLARGAGPRVRLTALLAAAAAAVVIVSGTSRLYHHVYERLLFKRDYVGEPFMDVLENRHGVVAVTMGDSTTYSGGAYDGGVSTGLRVDRNTIRRAYAVAGLHPRPRDVLMIGMSTGAWTQVVAHLPGVERLTVVDINPAYVQLIRKYPQVASILGNPKISLVFDDGRRWLRRNPERRFDLILQNTQHHSRSHTTNLLSREYFELVRGHLQAGGVFHFNTTFSQDVMKTAFTVFPYGLRVINFVTVSDSPVEFDHDRWMRTLRTMRIDGQPVLDTALASDARYFSSLDAFGRSAQWKPLAGGLETRESVLSRIPAARVITDDNLLPEMRTLLLFQ